MSLSLIGPWPALDFALARLGALRGTPVALAGPLDPAKAVLAARLRLAGGDVQEGLSNTPCYVLDAVGEDLTGQLGATSRAPMLAQSVPVVDLSSTPLMRLAHDQIGIGQASVMALLDITNLQLAGRRVVICGHGPSGAGVAAHVAALGGRVCVVETDPVRAAQAIGAGFDVEGFAQALPAAEVVFVTDDGPDLTLTHALRLSKDTLLCASGATAAISPEIIAVCGYRHPIRAHVDGVVLPNGTPVKLVADGQPLHLAEGQGLPREASDIVLALHILALAQLLHAAPSQAGSIPLDPDVEAALAAHIVAQNGGQLEA